MPDLEPVPEDWTRALAVVAHPDDLEYGAASAIARWTAQGKEITYCLVTSGEAGIDGLAPDECARLRQAEERASAAAVGVDTVEFLAHPDGLVEASVELRRDLAATIRRLEELEGKRHGLASKVIAATVEQERAAEENP